MLTRVASDPEYAKQRGMAQSVAQEMLRDHAQAGSPQLVPGHIGSKGPTPRVKKPKRPSGLLGRHR